MKGWDDRLPKPWHELTETEQYERQRGEGCDLCKRNGIGSGLAMTKEAAEKGCTLEALGEVSAMGLDDPPVLLRLRVCRDCRPAFLLQTQLFVDKLHRDWRKRVSVVQIAETRGKSKKTEP